MRGRLARYVYGVLALGVAASVSLGAVSGVRPWDDPFRAAWYAPLSPSTPAQDSAEVPSAEDCRSLEDGLARVRDLLRGLPFETPRVGAPHAVLIWFRTDVPGVDIPSAERAKFPSSMSIILQHQYRELVLAPESIRVTAWFEGVSARVIIPMNALIAVYDETLGTQIDLRQCG